MTFELEARGHAVTLACRRRHADTVIARARAEGVERIETLRLASGVKPVADAADVRSIAKLLRDSDIVHVHRGKEHWLAAVANRLTRTPRPLVRTRHIVQMVRAHAPNRWLYGQATALVVAVTDAIRQQYLAAGLVPPERLVTLSGGVDAKAYHPCPPDPEVRKRLGASEDALLVGMVAGLRGMKGHGVVVDAVAQLAREGIRLRLVFVGRGPMEPVIREAIRSAGIDEHVTIAGFAQYLPPVMASLDIALYVPLESEGMSRVLFEYLAAGRPVVASRVGVVPEVLADSENASLVPAGDAPALAEALRRLIADPARRAQLGGRGRSLVETRYSGARVAQALETLYARLVAA
jgi:glycosyltransferase involved in cell wall biosynthesis